MNFRKTILLGDVVSIEKGKKAPCTLEHPSATSIRYLQIEDLRPNAARKYVEPFACPRARASDVVIAWDGANAGTVSTGLDGLIGSTLAVLRTNEELVTGSYLSRLLEFSFNYLQSTATGATVPHVSRDALEGIRVPLLSLAEQESLSCRFNVLAQLRAVRRYALELSEGAFGAVFLEMFGDQSLPRVSIGALLATAQNSIRTGPFGSQLLHSEFSDVGVSVLGIDNVVNNRFEWAERRYIDSRKYEQLRRYTVHPGDVLISLMGTCGRCAIVPEEIPLAINTKHLCAITPNREKCLPEFLQGAFLFDPVVRAQLQVATKGSIMDGLNMQIIQELRIPLPSLVRQEKFRLATLVVERLRKVAKENLRQAEHLFQTLLTDAFGVPAP